MSVLIIGLGVVACSAAPTPSASSPPPSPPVAAQEPITTPAPDPGVSWLRVAPQEGPRGSAVSLDVACLDTLGTVRSPVLDIGILQPDPEGHQPWHLTGTATVRPDAAPGQYPVSATCGTETISAVITVVPHR